MAVELTWLGHATWTLKAGEYSVMVDPFLTENPAATLSVDDFATDKLAVDYVLLTHGHFDHVADAAEIAKRCDATLVANYEIATWFEKQGVAKTIGMNLGGALQLPFGLVKMTVAFHSSQLPDGSYGGNPGGFLVEIPNGPAEPPERLYFAGDTALFSDMKLIGAGGLDVAILPIGDLFTMGIEDSLAAINFLKCKHVIPGHFNTWPPIEQDVEDWAQRVAAQTNANPIVPKVGQTISV